MALNHEPTEDRAQVSSDMSDDVSSEGPPGSIDAEPGELFAPTGDRVFYRINIRRVTYAEFRMSSPRSTAVLAWVLVNLFGVRSAVSTDDPAVQTLGPFETGPEAIRQDVRTLWEEPMAQLEALGFHSPVYHAIHDTLHTTETYLVSMAHRSLPVVARLHVRFWRRVHNAPRPVFTEFITACRDGTFLWTLSSPPDMKVPPSCVVTRSVGLMPRELWPRHEAVLTQRRPLAALPAGSAQDVRDVCERHHAAVRDFHLERGVFAPRTKADDDRAQAELRTVNALAAAGSQYPQVQHELIDLQTRTTSWVKAAVILAVSLVVFLAVGLPGQRSFLGLLALVPILLFHELGHYAAMRACGYRNLRMFFIPGFGAAVSGRAFNVPGWKRAVVALMGPIPGIILGIIVGLCGVVAQSPLAINAALLMVIVNGFNLVPVLPFDGGRVLHAVLFSRHYALDAVFRGAAALGVLALSVLLNAQILIAIGVVMLVSLPLAMRLARTAADLRREGVGVASPDDQSVPIASAERIIDRLATTSKKPVPPKVLAQQTLEVFEMLNTRPTGWLSGIALVGVHGVSLVAALVFSVVFAMASSGKLQNYIQAGLNAPQHALPLEHVKPGPPAAQGTHATQSTVVATYERSSDAAAAHQDALLKAGPGESVSRLGNTVMVRYEAADANARTHWIAALGRRGGDSFVHGETMQAHFRFQVLMPSEDAAKALEEEARAFFLLPMEHGLIPPWCDAPLTPEHTLARATYAELGGIDVYDSPEIKDLLAKASEARKRGDAAEAQALSDRFETRSREIELERIRAVGARPGASVDAVVVRAYEEMAGMPRDDAEARSRAAAGLASRLGQAPARWQSTCVQSGWAYRQAAVVNLTAQFDDPGVGAAAVARWLAAKGGGSLRYEVYGMSPSDGGE